VLCKAHQQDNQDNINIMQSCSDEITLGAKTSMSPNHATLYLTTPSLAYSFFMSLNASWILHTSADAYFSSTCIRFLCRLGGVRTPDTAAEHLQYCLQWGLQENPQLRQVIQKNDRWVNQGTAQEFGFAICYFNP
jgi:hypothetical protein